jgi:methylphosphotriester-DNA--protein-cysteine methyltransferase
MKVLELLPPSETMYRALVNRDPSFEGIFCGRSHNRDFLPPNLHGEKTGAQNVDFFATPSQALHGGYRPCLRCHPMDPDKRPPRLIERLRAEVERAPGGRLTDKELAGMAIDPSTARRQFKRHYGMTFQAYHRARRMGLALREVQKGGRVEEARNGSGFESESGFRELPASFADPPIAAKLRSQCSSSESTRHFGNGQSLMMVGLAFAFRGPARNGKGIVDLTEAFADKHCAGRASVSGRDSFSARRLLFWQEAGIRYSSRTGRFGFSTASLEDFAFHPGRRNAVVLLDGGTFGRSQRTARRRSSQRHEHDMHRYSVSSRYSR